MQKALHEEDARSRLSRLAAGAVKTPAITIDAPRLSINLTLVGSPDDLANKLLQLGFTLTPEGVGAALHLLPGGRGRPAELHRARWRGEPGAWSWRSMSPSSRTARPASQREDRGRLRGRGRGDRRRT